MPRVPARAVLVLLAALLLPIALCAGGCAAPRAPTTARRPTPTATVSLLARTVLAVSVSTRLVALRASDGQERWHVGDWTWPLPGGGGELIFGPVAPVADGGMLLATANADHTGIPTAYAFHPADGSIRWHTPLAGCIAGGSPLVAGGVLYIALTGHASSNLDCGPSGWVYALREADGAVLWRKPFARVVFPSLALSGGVLVVLHDDYPADPETAYLTGLRPDDGAVLWQVQRPAGLSEAFAAGDGVVVLSRTLRIGYTDQWTAHIEAFRAADGTRVWQAEPAVHFEATIEAIAHGLVYVYSDLGELSALRVADGSTAWRYQTGGQSIGAPALVGDALYVGAGPGLLVLDAANGTRVRAYTLTPSSSPTSTADDAPSLWTRPLLTGGTIVVAAAVVTSNGFRGYADWALYAVDQASGRVLWQRPAPAEAAYSAPVAVELPVGGSG
jgi:outer membrane protein assembly factor BamB